jgi:outer membrane lipoprotein-sorting protein
MRKKHIVSTVLVLWSISSLGAQGDEPSGKGALDAWLAHQEKVKTWTADVKQTRQLKALKRALTTPGRIWFAGHHQFRWELGDPVRTLAFRRDQELLVLYPQLRRAEKYEFASVKEPAMQQARLLMDVGFPAEPNEFHSLYELLSHSETETEHLLKLRPRDEQAREVLTELKLKIRKADWALLSTEMSFPDGSGMSNTFSNHQFNVALPAHILEPDLKDYTLVEPLKGP